MKHEHVREWVKITLASVAALFMLAITTVLVVAGVKSGHYWSAGGYGLLCLFVTALLPGGVYNSF